MEENNQNYIYGFPKVTQIVLVRQNLENLVVRIPRTFFIPHPFHRSVHYEGLSFEVFRIKENAENHSAVCTGILKFHHPKTLKQLKDLITILTYFAKRDQQIIRLVKDIFSKQLHRMAMQAQTTPLPLVDLTTESAQHPHTTHSSQLPCTSSGRRQHTSGFHPYPRTNRAEGSKSHLIKYQNSTPKSDQQVLLHQSSFNKQPTCSQSVFNNNTLDQQSNNISSMGSSGYVFQPNFSKLSDQPMINQFQIRDLTSGMIHSPSVYPNHLQDYNNQKIVPTVHTHNVTSNKMSSDVRVLQPNELGNPNKASYQPRMENTTSVHDPSTTAYHDQLNQQQIIPPSHTHNIASKMTNSLSNIQQNQFRNPDQQCQPQIQIPSQRIFNQPTYLPLNNNHQPNGTNQAQFANSFPLQNLNPSQNVQLVSNNMHYLSTPHQINARPQNYDPVATVNHFPSASFQDHVFIERNQQQMAPSTSNNHLAPNFFSPPQTSYRPENCYPVQSHQNLYSQNNITQWPNNILFSQNPDFPRSQNCPMVNPINSLVNYEIPPQTSCQHYQEHMNWHMPSLPQMKTQQVIQSTQACNNYATTISSNKCMNTLVEPTTQECTRISNPSMHSMQSNSLASANFSGNVKSNNQDSNSLSTHAEPVNRLNERISGVTTNPRAQNIPQSSSATAKFSNNLQHILDVLNYNIKSGTKANSQSLVTQHKSGFTNHSQANFIKNGFIKDEPIDNEASETNEDRASQHKPLSFVNLEKETSKSLEVAPEDKTDDEPLPSLIIVPDDELDEDIFEIINSSSCEVINSPSSSSVSSQCLVIDENTIV